MANFIGINSGIGMWQGGGGRASTPPAPSAVAPVAAPSTTQLEVQQSQRETRERAARRRGYASTILAGETGGPQPSPVLGQPTQAVGTAATQANRTLLGGV